MEYCCILRTEELGCSAWFLNGRLLVQIPVGSFLYLTSFLSIRCQDSNFSNIQELLRWLMTYRFMQNLQEILTEIIYDLLQALQTHVVQHCQQSSISCQTCILYSLNCPCSLSLTVCVICDVHYNVLLLFIIIVSQLYECVKSAGI